LKTINSRPMCKQKKYIKALLKACSNSASGKKA